MLWPPSVSPPRSPPRTLGPTRYLVHRADSLGFMNQTIGAVRTGDKSRFLTPCYRAAARNCWHACIANAWRDRKTPEDQLVLDCLRAHLHCLSASATGPRRWTAACP